MSKRVLLATEKAFAAVAVKGIESIFADAKYELVKLENYKSKADFLGAVKGVDALIIRSDEVDKEVLEAADSLKIVVRAGAGTDNIKVDIAKEKGVVAMNTPGQNSNAVAELVFGMMVYIARGQFNGKSGTELQGKKLGIHAYGNVGRLVAKIAKGFGMEVFAFDTSAEKIEDMKKDNVHIVKDIVELYKTCDYVSLHIPKTKETTKSINYGLLSLMPAGATLINTARVEVICEESLLRIMSERKDFRYATDVMPEAHDKFKEFGDRYYATPKKMGAQTEEANINAGLAAARQIVDFFEKGDVRFKVN
ncbi:MAG: NAD(P)-binding domain-containing protein [Candidatus Cloacimonetes bacterium]|nr:NAD(P)-binding domain-containing protein [Candidatus Cloacimonadota bacterium]